MSRRLRRLNRRNTIKPQFSIIGNPSNHSQHDSDVKKVHSNDSVNDAQIHHSVHHKPKGFVELIIDIYDKKYKTLLIIPFLLLFISLVFLGVRYTTTGSFIDLGVSIKGGLFITALGDISFDAKTIESKIYEKFPNSDVSARLISNSGQTVGVTVEVSDVTEESFMPVLKSTLGDGFEYSVESTGSSLGKSFFQQMMLALFLAFILMGLVVFISFRTVIPSLAVILCAASDMVVTLAVISFMDIKLSLAGIAAFLMLIGYSVDTDILLTTRVLKRTQGTVFERILSSVDTGFLMNLTTLGAVGVGLLVSQSEVLKQIMLILFIGLIVDMINTWIQNVALIRMYAEKKFKEGTN